MRNREDFKIALIAFAKKAVTLRVRVLPLFRSAR